MEVRVGTSGWHYKHWLGPVYPKDLPALAWYAHSFRAVELNNTFYRLPTESALETWRATVPADFRFAVKGSRFITHMKKLKDPEVALNRFFNCVDLLHSKVGPIVFQLPPNWPVDVDRLADFLQALPKAHRYAFEFRHSSWHTERVYQLLNRHRSALCIYHLAGFTSPLEITTDFAYLRLHGPGGKYQGLYDTGTLSLWADRIWSWNIKAAWVFFDNDDSGFAIQNAREFCDMLGDAAGRLELHKK
jgi:uncharacterized protein YecE (DUF72 family)